MKTIQKLGAVAAACLTASALALAPASAATGFVGSWTAVDTDGSNLTLAVHGAGARVAVRSVDDVASSACAGGRAVLSGAGRVSGDLLEARVLLACNPGGNVFRERITLTWTYNPDGTLTDDFGVVWTRAA